MPDPNMTYRDALEMFGTEEEKESYKKKFAAWDEWLKDIPVYEPKVPFIQPKPKEKTK